MNKCTAGLFGLIFLFYSVTACGAEPVSEIPPLWTAKNSVTFSLANSPDSRVALQRMEMANAAVAQSRVAYYPHVDISAGYGQTNNPMYSFGNILNQGVFTPSIDFNDRSICKFEIFTAPIDINSSFFLFNPVSSVSTTTKLNSARGRP